jgi:CelD/BcsL family acetyltransferase involved in cellulose biosynthesis
VTLRFEVLRTPEELEALAHQWDALAVRSGTPFLSPEWLLAWWRAFARDGYAGGRAFVLLGRDPSGAVRTGAFLQSRPAGRVGAAANVHTVDWDTVADGQESERACWREIAGLGGHHLQLVALRDPAADAARSELSAAGHRVFAVPHEASPRQPLPATWEELTSSVTANLRKRLRQLERGLDSAGRVVFRTNCGGSDLDRDLAAFFELEASGWKGREGTAILDDPRTAMLYREFAVGAAVQGRLRLHLLELDGRLIAADLGCAFAGGAFLIKTAYAEDHARLSPGLVLRARALRASIEEGCSFYDFLGGAQPWKLRWGATPSRRWTVDGYRGAWRPVAAYRSRVRPVLKACRDRFHTRRRDGAR